MNVGRPLVEISIIVIGVLIAPGVDSWNDNRIDQILERQYLERLREDISYNADSFLPTPEESFDRKLAHLDEVADLALRPDDYRLDLGSLRDSVRRSAQFGWAIPEIRTGIFEELKNTGNLGLIRDLNLRTALNDYDLSLRSRFVRIAARMTDYPRYVSGLLALESFAVDLEVNSELVD